MAFPIAYLIGKVLHESIGIPEAGLFVVVAMLYVTFARGRLIGSSVMIHESQYPRVFAIVRRACAALEIPLPLIFVREDPNVPAAALGFGEPYALVLSSHWVEHFEDDELAFVVGRELGHIAAGHTRYLSLLSINGNENAIIALIFGAWLRMCDYTCDKVGLLVCGSLDAATRAIAVSTFHHFGRKINVAQFAEQGREVANDSVLQIGEWIGSEPYATNRIAAMRRFEGTAHFNSLEAWFLRDVEEPPPLPRSGEMKVTRADCAGWWRRATAVFIDASMVGLISLALTGQQNVAHVTKSASTPAPIASHAPGTKWTNSLDTLDTDESTQSDTDQNEGVLFDAGPIMVTTSGLHLRTSNQTVKAVADYFGQVIGLAVYLAVLVGLVGQSFGMMITGLRVVTPDFRPPGIWRSVIRYVIASLFWLPLLLLSPIMRRVMLHDRLSGTRLITSERILARTAAQVRS